MLSSIQDTEKKRQKSDQKVSKFEICKKMSLSEMI